MRDMVSVRTMSLWLLFVASGCSQTAPVSRDQGPGNSGNAGAAKVETRQETGVAADAPVYDPGGPIEPSPKYKNAVIPEVGAKCSFEERDPGERPKHFIPASHSSNIIFYHRPKGPLWSDIDPNGAIAELEENELIVAARYQMPDLWIRPKGGRVTLEVGQKRLTCY